MSIKPARTIRRSCAFFEGAKQLLTALQCRACDADLTAPEVLSALEQARACGLFPGPGWCSGSCRTWANRNPGCTRAKAGWQRKCQTCGGWLSGRRYRFCSFECGRMSTRAFVACEVCGGEFECEAYGASRDKYRTTCSDACLRETSRRGGHRGGSTPHKAPEPRPCADCATLVSTTGTVALCESCGEKRRNARWRRKNAVRRGSNASGPTISIDELGDRDNWRCHLCRRKVHRHLRHPHPSSATFDHLIPVSQGGADTPENLRLAHRLCNCKRGAGGEVQLLLIG